MVQRRFWDDNVVCQSTAPAGQPEEAVAPAAIVQTLFTCRARFVIENRLYNDSVSLLVVFHVVSYFLNYTAEFMAERQRDGFSGDWVWRCRTEVWAAEVLMEIWKLSDADSVFRGYSWLATSTNPYPGWLDLDLSRLHFWDWNLFITQIVLAVEPDGVHASIRHITFDW